ncbi:MAG: type II secretion system F family protein [Nitrospiraceae bacterium]|nr:type II secretion system F family protein [Nitrospiraceae bacterium]
MNYSYQAINGVGSVVKGTIDAASVQAAEEAIASGGLIPVRVAPAKAKEGSFEKRAFGTGQKVKTRELILFSKQFRSMFNAGIPILRILEVLEKQSENSSLKKAASAIREDISQGHSLMEAMERHSSIFSPLYRSMIGAGETSGKVPEVLERLSYMLEHEDRVKSDIRSAMQYPVVVVITLAGAFFFLLAFVIPKFTAVFSKAHLTLPLPTRIAISMHDALLGHGFTILLATIGLIACLRMYLKTEKGIFVKDAFLLRLPVFGPLFIKAAVSRFSSILAILLSSGVPVINAFTVLSGSIGNSAIARAFDSIKGQMVEGKGIAGPLSEAKYFTPMVVSMVAIGEESGELEEMLQEISVHYDEEVKYAVSRLADLITPALTVALAFVVGFFALAIFMPMWDMTKMVK